MADLTEEPAPSKGNESKTQNEYDNNENGTQTLRSTLRGHETSSYSSRQKDEKDLYREERDVDRKRHRDDDYYDEKHRKSEDRDRYRHHSRDDDKDRYRDRDRYSDREKDYRRNRDDRDRYIDTDRKSDRNYHPSNNRSSSYSDNNYQPRTFQKPLTAQEKKKLLWSSKKTEPVDNTATWKAAEFDDPQRKNKFLKLMGAKKKEAYNPLDPDSEEEKKEEPQEQVTNVENAYTLEKQAKLYNDLERQFIGGLSRFGSQGKSGLG